MQKHTQTISTYTCVSSLSLMFVFRDPFRILMSLPTERVIGGCLFIYIYFNKISQLLFFSSHQPQMQKYCICQTFCINAVLRESHIDSSDAQNTHEHGQQVDGRIEVNSHLSLRALNQVLEGPICTQDHFIGRVEVMKSVFWDWRTS